ncbi:glycosyltransferase [Catenovulum sp. SM1970]|uniref:glycosyltransferase n=1 Tax=Marinifaba aquimaris TaxID=2741323 RepID=UPI00157358B0|nr:glycosyltransferase [Marinifaba aquimaris]NTS76925.1 glycosyltransferase [Marinifaba aquimaris]
MKIGLLVEPDFLTKHVGVRSVIYTIYSQLKTFSEVCFISNLDGMWFEMHIPYEMILNNNFTSSWYIEGKPEHIPEVYNRAGGKRLYETKCSYKCYFSQIGSDISSLNLDWLFITAPWVISPSLHIPKNIKLAGIVHDLIPNRYVFEKRATQKPFEFAYEHHLGYYFYDRNVDIVFTNSDFSRIEFLKFYNHKNVVTLSPLTPNSLYERDDNEKTARVGRKIILGNFLDERKGLGILKELFSKPNICDELVLYGAIRCPVEKFYSFFKTINMESVRWYPEISSKQLTREFKSSNLFLFPSQNEGLGLPVIEAQCNGVPVLTAPFGSVREVQLNDSHTICWDDIDLVMEKVKSTFRDNQLPETIETLSRSTFSHKKLRDKLIKHLS